MGMREAAQVGEPLALEPVVRAVRVALAVREHVVLAMVGDPGDHRPLDRGGPENREQRADRPGRGEAAMGEVAVEADGHAQAGQQIEHAERDQVVEMQAPLGALPRDEADADDGDDRDQPGRDPVRGFVLDRLNVLGTDLTRHL